MEPDWNPNSGPSESRPRALAITPMRLLGLVVVAIALGAAGTAALLPVLSAVPAGRVAKVPPPLAVMLLSSARV